MPPNAHSTSHQDRMCKLGTRGKVGVDGSVHGAAEGCHGSNIGWKERKKWHPYKAELIVGVMFAQFLFLCKSHAHDGIGSCGFALSTDGRSVLSCLLDPLRFQAQALIPSGA
eukprot:1159973-Pelagomonas_calceolata.AAC.21